MGDSGNSAANIINAANTNQQIGSHSLFASLSGGLSRPSSGQGMFARRADYKNRAKLMSHGAQLTNWLAQENTTRQHQTMTHGTQLSMDVAKHQTDLDVHKNREFANTDLENYAGKAAVDTESLLDRVASNDWELSRQPEHIRGIREAATSTPSSGTPAPTPADGGGPEPVAPKRTRKRRVDEFGDPIPRADKGKKRGPRAPKTEVVPGSTPPAGETPTSGTPTSGAPTSGGGPTIVPSQIDISTVSGGKLGLKFQALAAQSSDSITPPALGGGTTPAPGTTPTAPAGPSVPIVESDPPRPTKPKKKAEVIISDGPGTRPVKPAKAETPIKKTAPAKKAAAPKAETAKKAPTAKTATAKDTAKPGTVKKDTAKKSAVAKKAAPAKKATKKAATK